MKLNFNKHLRAVNEADKSYERIEPGNGVLALVKPAKGEQVHGIIYHGKASKPVEHYLYRSRVEFNARLAAVVERAKAHEAYVAKRKAERKAAMAARAKTADEVVERAAKASGTHDLESYEVALLLRARLDAEFPGVKFSVTSDYNSIHVSYTDGPRLGDVMDVFREFRFGGFDGSIDLAYSTSKFLMPGYRLVPAESDGTASSRGSVAAYSHPRPDNAVAQVSSSVKYGHVSREYSLRARASFLASRGVNTDGLFADTIATLFLKYHGAEEEAFTTTGEMAPIDQTELKL